MSDTNKAMQMSKIKFSVIIPTCDRPLLLKKTLKSVFSQVLEPFEILIIDNGAKQIEVEIFKQDKKIRYIRALPRIGVAQARNIGICLATGDYIAFLDDDDTWDKDYLKEVADTVTKTSAAVVLGSVKILETRKLWKSKSGPIKSVEHFKRQLLITNPGALGSNLTVERKLILASPGFDPFLIPGEDRGLVFELLSNYGAKVARAEKAFTYYRTIVRGVRLTNRNTLVKDKARFLLKYWGVMDFKIRFIVLVRLLKQTIKNILGVDYIRKRDE